MNNASIEVLLVSLYNSLGILYNMKPIKQKNNTNSDNSDNEELNSLNEYEEMLQKLSEAKLCVENLLTVEEAISSTNQT